MGFAFYLKYTLGFIPSAEKLESKYNTLIEKQERLKSVSESEAVKDYLDLNSIVGQIDKAEAKKISKTTYNEEEDAPKIVVQKQLKEFDELKNSTEVKDYLSLLEDKDLEFFKQWNTVYNEDFSEGKETLQNNWVSGDPATSKMVGTISQGDELQCFNGFENIELKGKGATLHIKKEQKQGMAWDARFGFLPKNFDYTSAHINSNGSYQLNEGYVEVKMKFKPQKGLTHALCLKGENQFPIVDIIRSTDKGVGFGVVKGENDSDYSTLKSINFNKSHIFRLEVTKSTLTWKLNEEVVFTAPNQIPSSEFTLNWLSTVHQELSNNSAFDIDWIRAYAPAK